MLFTQLPLQGAWQIDLEKREDERGFFARLFCVDEFMQHGLNTEWAQCNNSMSVKAGTVRGMHFQRAPAAEDKMLRCLRGSIYDVLVDLRSNSTSYGKWTALELSAANRTMAYIPKGFAHGFQTLEDNTELLYFHSEKYTSEHEGGVRFDDPDLAISWPLEIAEISERDKAHPGLEKLEPL
jgi:dTDP-4-dehydrorhamnose 3,5-epimerase